jgi:putative flippase GtrA
VRFLNLNTNMFRQTVRTALASVRTNLIVPFLKVGVLNAAFGYFVFALIYLMFGRYQAAVIVATVAGVLFNFVTTGRWVFRNASLIRIIPFALGYAAIMIVNVLVIDLGVALGIDPLLGQILAIPVIVVLSFLINDRLVFRATRA